ncbi:unnamed protein product [Brachionus calyciflorus]|uniref:ATP-dependent DNA helicase n=1 Tax=Brachionus calyciflorus TaxID=104777 RepID=A0A814L516_9BILA|nr:unnamed protein product [Brachionus calyciflorus]
MSADRGTYTYRISGSLHHNLGSYMPDDDNQAKFSQIYIYDQGIQSQIRNNLFPELNTEILKIFQQYLHSENPYVHIFQQVGQRIKDEPTENINIVLKDNYKKDKRYNTPTSDEIAVLMINDSSEDEKKSSRDIIIFKKCGQLQRISELHGSYDPLHYVLMHLHGEQGWVPKTLPLSTVSSNKQSRNLNHDEIDENYSENLLELSEKNSKFMTAMQYYSYILYERPDISLYLFGRLFHQYIVDQYAKMEMGRLNFIRFNQDKIRADMYKGIMEAVLKNDHVSSSSIGTRLILPSSFTGGPRHMHQLYLDAMSIVRAYGKPDLFITFTCNPNWPEIKNALKKNQDPNDRPDIIARVFRLKVKLFLNDLLNNKIFGKVVAHIYVVEFQKRGLPHVHILLILDKKDKPLTVEDYDKIVSAELPDPIKYPKLFETVTKCMVHGPCGVLNPNSPCMKNGVCSKNYPKAFKEKTEENANGYPIYRRSDNGISFEKNGFLIDNRWIVPYNPYLSNKYNAHINVEICSSVASVKYLYKYVYKGHDKVTMTLNNEKSSEDLNKNEINEFLDARYVSAIEACWRLFRYPMHGQSPSTSRLPVHLENEQNITYKESELIKEVLEKNSKTQLTEYFKLNSDEKEISKNIFYHEMPKFYVWLKKEKIWKLRSRPKLDVVGRVYFVHPADTERFSLRTLLLYKKGAVSYDDLKTINGKKASTFKQALQEMGMLETDEEWELALKEASDTESNGIYLRELFSNILTQCQPSSPLLLWEKFKHKLSEDLHNQLKIEYNNPFLKIEEVYPITLQKIEQKLRKNGKCLEDFGFSSTNTTILYPILNEKNSLIEEELSYDKNNLQKHLNDNLPKLNNDQRNVFDKIVDSAEERSEQKLFFIDGPGGTGKTFLYKNILAYIRSKNKIALAVASSGIAALLLPGGRTAHSRFKIPINLFSNSTCNIKLNSPEAELIKKAELILWDEAPMMHKFAFEALDRTLKDIMKEVDPKNEQKLFGNKLIVLGGDFRQILPVVKKGSRPQIVNSSINRSKIWKSFKVLKLKKNMRLNQNDIASAEFSKFLMRVGEGKEKYVNDNEGNNENIEVPEDLTVKCSQKELIELIFPKISDNNIDYESIAKSAILTSKNIDVDRFNELATSLFPGEERKYYSVDSVLNDAHTALYPLEFLNTINLSGMPPHKLNLKIGMPIILLRNVSPAEGLCNGTRLIISKFHSRVIECKIAVGEEANKTVFIPRMPLVPTDSGLPFELKRLQFPIRPAFAITINKAQGQTLEKVGVFLEEPVFTHGQLYVAFSRVTKRQNLKICLNNQKNVTKNIVYTEVL